MSGWGIAPYFMVDDVSSRNYYRDKLRLQYEACGTSSLFCM